MRTIPLGFEVGSGEPVGIPLKHLAITGQTQEAGKTTALEALITRAGVKALTFVTKRGEGSFVQARRIDPYFREQADWQFVASLLEASRGEKLKFERAWIIRASRGARTLEDVQRNVKRAQEKATGLSADVYLVLDAYLEVVVPQIARVRWAPGLALAPGVNAMDLTGLTVEMQHLVIRSSIDWVLTQESHTVVVVPEALKFIPQGRGTPVKLAAEAFIRQAAACDNFLWLDSQDLGGIEKTILRSVPVWMLGVQREANEIARTLANIPAVVAKPKASALALLELGQFFVCWGSHAIKTYVQPEWMAADLARQVAQGALDARTAGQIAGGAAVRRAAERAFAKEDSVTKTEANRLTEEIAALREENRELRRQVQALTKGAAHDDDHRSTPPPVRARDSGAAGEPRAQRTNDHPTTVAPHRAAAQPGAADGGAGVDDALYQAIKARLLADATKDPQILEVLVARPEIRVKVERHALNVDGASTRGRIARLIADDFFEKARTTTDVLTELERRGRRPSNIELGNELKTLTELGFFTRENKWYTLVPTMRANVVEVS
jgi:hypothetical protein